MQPCRAKSSQPRPPARVRAALAAALVLLAGCKTTTYVLQVDAISQAGEVAQKDQEPKSFKVVSPNPRIAEDSLRYHEVSDYVKTALSGKGLYEAPSAETADLIIEIDYGMETPRMKYQRVTTPVITIREPMSVRDPVPISNTSSRREAFRTLSIPSQKMQKMVENQEEAELVVVYEKFLKVSARENQESVEGRPPPEVWSVNVSAEDQSNELRKYLPILASATADFIGTNTKREKSVAVSEGDGSVRFIKKGM